MQYKTRTYLWRAMFVHLPRLLPVFLSVRLLIRVFLLKSRWMDVDEILYVRYDIDGHFETGTIKFLQTAIGM
jgi:hypothetical protein